MNAEDCRALREHIAAGSVPSSTAHLEGCADCAALWRTHLALGRAATEHARASVPWSPVVATGWRPRVGWVALAAAASLALVLVLRPRPQLDDQVVARELLDAVDYTQELLAPESELDEIELAEVDLLFDIDN